ncbi:MAG: maleylacetoacetate isomerase [Burkholderiaceae bacterium]|nr:maleylacetoacetate isomerase [Burkholderiaceae bacterium]
MKLYNFFRSSAAFRVRIALNLKGLAYDYVPVHLAKGEHKQPVFAAMTAEGLIPVLELDDGRRLTQSMAIIEYLDEAYPDPALLPADAHERARVRALAQIVACDIHPLNNLRVLKYLVHELKASQDAKNDWCRHWMRLGLESFEAYLSSGPAGAFSHGDVPTLADCFLVPQIFNARRLDCDLSGLPRTIAVFDACMELPSFRNAQPSACPDFEP